MQPITRSDEHLHPVTMFDLGSPDDALISGESDFAVMAMNLLVLPVNTLAPPYASGYAGPLLPPGV